MGASSKVAVIGPPAQAATCARVAPCSPIMLPSIHSVSGISASEVAFIANDVDATHAEWLAKGTTILQGPTDMDFGRTFTAADPDGHRLRVFKPGG